MAGRPSTEYAEDEFNISNARIKLGDIVNNACFNNVVTTIHSTAGRKVAVIPYHMLRELIEMRAAQSAKVRTLSDAQRAAHKALHKAVQEYAAQFPLVTPQGNSTGRE